MESLISFLIKNYCLRDATDLGELLNKQHMHADIIQLLCNHEVVTTHLSENFRIIPRQIETSTAFELMANKTQTVNDYFRERRKITLKHPEWPSLVHYPSRGNRNNKLRTTSHECFPLEVLAISKDLASTVLVDRTSRNEMNSATIFEATSARTVDWSREMWDNVRGIKPQSRQRTTTSFERRIDLEEDDLYELIGLTISTIGCHNRKLQW